MRRPRPKLSQIGPTRIHYPQQARRSFAYERVEDGVLALVLLPAKTLELITRRHLGARQLRPVTLILTVAALVALGVSAAAPGLALLAVLVAAMTWRHYRDRRHRLREGGGQDRVEPYYEGDPWFGQATSLRWRWAAVSAEILGWFVIGLLAAAVDGWLGAWILLGSCMLAFKAVLLWQHMIYRWRLLEAQQYADGVQLSAAEKQRFIRPNGFGRADPPATVQATSVSPSIDDTLSATFNSTRDGLPDGLRNLLPPR